MDEIDFTLDGTRFQLTREAVIRAMRRQIPGRIQTHAVEVEGVRFPVKQVLAQALQIPVTRFVSTRAQDLLTKLDFKVINVEETPPTTPTSPQWGRSLALQLAVEFYATRTEAVADDVLNVATSFAHWLAGPREQPSS